MRQMDVIMYKVKLVSAIILLEEVGLKCIGEYDSMSDLAMESNGLFFHVPNFVINDPVFKKDFVVDEAIEEKTIEVH